MSPQAESSFRERSSLNQRAMNGADCEFFSTQASDRPREEEKIVCNADIDAGVVVGCVPFWGWELEASELPLPTSMSSTANKRPALTTINQPLQNQGHTYRHRMRCSSFTIQDPWMVLRFTLDSLRNQRSSIFFSAASRQAL